MWDSVFKFIKLLNSEQAPHQLSLGLTLSMLVGLSPTFSLHNLVVLFLLLVLRANISAFMLGWLVFAALGLLLDPVLHGLGHYLLSLDSLRDTWTAMYNNSFWRISNFNNTIVMGSVAFSLLAMVPFFFLSNFLIKRYRSYWQQRFRAFYERYKKLFKIGQFATRFSGQ